jgi:CheY-like chemotaxis protein
MSPKKIMVVDDENINLELFKNFLITQGYDVIAVGESKDVINTVKKQKPKAIIMDIIMPGENGDEIAKKLKEDPKTKEIPIILITANILKESKNLGTDYFIRRPVIGDKLLNILDSIFTA